ncbi:reprolysin-like metallopeptidase [Thiothrix eikelboomii]|uniref:reprolysin-like metallopeptidase n=1 Tax=Thiothrix eikelboomii TaxID=92487 RepID=UPI003BAFC449
MKPQTTNHKPQTTNHSFKYLTSLIFLINASVCSADESFWQDQSSTAQKLELQTYQGVDSYINNLEKYRLLDLNETALNGLLNLTKRVRAREESTEAGVKLSLPLPNGKFIEVNAIPVTVIADQAAKESPDFRTWRIFGIDDPLVTGIIDTSHSGGFHGMVLLANGETVLINPVQDKKTRKYISFSEKSQNKRQEEAFSCAAGDDHSTHSVHKELEALEISQSSMPMSRRGTPTKTLNYDIIYTAGNTLVQNVGGAAALNNVINTMHARISQLFWRDTAINLLYTAGFYDTANAYLKINTADALMNANPLFMQALKTSYPTITALKNYDLSIALGYTTGGGGLARVGTVCSNNKDFAAFTGAAPTGVSYYKYVAHEIGHQFGAWHTFNKCILKSTNQEISRTKGSAVEPGAGATLMGYGGACNSPNAYSLGLPNDDTMLHINSIAEIVTFSRGAGLSCGLASSAVNNPPNVQTAAAYTIPAHTPFMLKGSASDVEGGALTYSWEQVDTIPLWDLFGTAVNLNEDNTKDALIRVLPPKSLPRRYIPAMDKLLSKATSDGEFLPVTTRKLTFELAVRDQRGGVGSSQTVINVRDTGAAFAITNPTQTDLRGSAGRDLNVQWNVAGTNASAFNCPSVQIAITTDNGASFKALLASTTNDGAQIVRLPTTLPIKSHLRVMCSNDTNVFFAISGTSPNLATKK